MRAFSTAGSGRTPAPGYNPLGLSGTYPVGATPGVKVDIGYGLHGDSTTGHQIDSANNDIRVNVLQAPSPYTIGYPAVNIPVFLLRPPPGAGAGARTVMLPFPVLNNLLDRFAGYSNVQNPAAVARLARYLGMCKSDGHTDETARTMYGGGARAAVVPAGTVPSCWDFWGVEVLGLDRLWLQLRARRIGPDAPPEDDAQDTRYMGKRPRLGEGVPDPAFGMRPAKRPSWAFYYHPVVVKGRELPPPFDWSQVWTPDPFPGFGDAADDEDEADTAGDVLMTGAPPDLGSKEVDAMKPDQYQPSLVYAKRPESQKDVQLKMGQGEQGPSLATLQMLYDAMMMYKFNDMPGSPLEWNPMVERTRDLLSEAVLGLPRTSGGVSTMRLSPLLALVQYIFTADGDARAAPGQAFFRNSFVQHDAAGIAWIAHMDQSIEIPTDDDVLTRSIFWEKLNKISSNVRLVDIPLRPVTTNGMVLVTLRALFDAFPGKGSTNSILDLCADANTRDAFVDWLVGSIGLGGDAAAKKAEFESAFSVSGFRCLDRISRWVFDSVGRPGFNFTNYYKVVLGKDVPSGKKGTPASSKKTTSPEDSDDDFTQESTPKKSKVTHTQDSETENAEHWERIRDGLYSVAHFIGVASAAVRDHHKSVKLLKAQTARERCLVPANSRAFAKALNDLPKVNIVVRTASQGDPAAYHNAQRTDQQCGLDTVYEAVKQ